MMNIYNKSSNRLIPSNRKVFLLVIVLSFWIGIGYYRNLSIRSNVKKQNYGKLVKYNLLFTLLPILISTKQSLRKMAGIKYEVD